MQWTADRTAGLARLADFIPRAGRIYTEQRNFDDGVPDDGARTNVSQLSPWLHAGLLREREVIEAALAAHPFDACEQFVAEVFWRVYFKGYLEHRPSIWRAYCQERDAAHAALAADPTRAEVYARAIEGRTGIAAFDYWARELAATGYLHNHARMWAASIWIFTLKLDWQLGADWFLAHLIDGDAASNTLSWRWVAGLHTQGKTYLEPGIAQQMAVEQVSGQRNPVDTLSEKEFKVFLSLASGRSVQDIAEVMSLSPRTVGTHLYNIKQKLGASNSAELAIIAIRAGLIEP